MGHDRDRAVVVRLKRKKKDDKVEPYKGRQADDEGAELASMLARWAEDTREEVAGREEHAPRPEWLNDRACDNWSGLFAVAAIAGDEWPKRAGAAATTSIDTGDSSDLGERLIYDLREVFRAGRR